VRRFVQVFAWALSAVIVGGVIASASPGHQNRPNDDPASVISVAPVPTETSAPEPEETGAPESDEAEASDTGSGASTAPDFSACVGLTGLENAICRHEALLEVHPNDQGLANSLAHLQENLSKREGGDQGSGTHGHSDEPHGNSDEPHGNGNEPHGNGNEPHGNGNGNGHGHGG
jgi:hypothetical protein